MASQAFSIAFRSGKRADQSRTRTKLKPNQSRGKDAVRIASFSCWNTTTWVFLLLKYFLSTWIFFSIFLNHLRSVKHHSSALAGIMTLFLLIFWKNNVILNSCLATIHGSYDIWVILSCWKQCCNFLFLFVRQVFIFTHYFSLWLFTFLHNSHSLYLS